MKIKIHLLSYFLGVLCTNSALKASELHKAINSGRSSDAIAAISEQTVNMLFHGEAAIHLAVKMELYDVVTALISSGADVNLPTENGEFAADISYRTGNQQIYDVLVDAGAYRGAMALSRDLPKISFTKLMRMAEARDNFPFIYPIFFSDAEAFQKLRKMHKAKDLQDWEIAEVIGSIASEGFPNGSPSTAAYSELEKLLVLAKASDRLKERVKVALKLHNPRAIEPRETKKHEPLTLKDCRERFLAIDKKVLAIAYTAKEAVLMSRITPNQLSIWLHDEHLAETIGDYIFLTNRMKLLWSSFIVTANDQDERNAIARGLVEFGSHLLKLRNYSGAQLIPGILAQTTVSRLINLNAKSKTRLKKLEAVANLDFKTYNELLKANAKMPFIPILGVFLKKLKSHHERKPATVDIDWLLHFAPLLKGYHDDKRRASIYINDNGTGMIDFLDHSFPITEDVIEAFAYVDRPELFTFHLSFTSCRLTLAKCNAAEMVKAFRQLGLSNQEMMQILKAQIWSGSDLDKFLSQSNDKQEQKKVLMDLGLSENSAQRLRYNFFLSSIFDV